MVQDDLKGTATNESESEIDERKWSKPIMEKRRRERINRSLEELKRLVLEAQHRDSSRYTKLEKADILEMTVKHLRTLRSQQKTGIVPSSPALLSKYCAGCTNCVMKVTQYMTAQRTVDQNAGTQMLSPLASFCINTTQDNCGVGSGLEQELSCDHYQALPYPTRVEFEGNRAQVPLVTESSGHTATFAPAPSYVCQPRGIVPGTVPVRFVPVYNNELSSVHGVPQALFQTGHPVGFPIRDPLWRPF